MCAAWDGRLEALMLRFPQVYGDTEMFQPALQHHVYEPEAEYDNGSGFLIIVRDRSQALDDAVSRVFPGALKGYCTLHRVVGLRLSGWHCSGQCVFQMCSSALLALHYLFALCVESS
jgi:hypothetical protein